MEALRHPAYFRRIEVDGQVAANAGGRSVALARIAVDRRQSVADLPYKKGADQRLQVVLVCEVHSRAVAGRRSHIVAPPSQVAS